MRDFFRLCKLVGHYWSQFAAAFLLMAWAGAMDGTLVLLTGPVFDRVLNPSSGGSPVLLSDRPLPLIHRQINLDVWAPHWISHNPASLVAIAIIVVVALNGICDYFGAYMISWVGFGVVTDLRNKLFEKLIHQSAAFYQKHSTGKLMSTTVNDIERIQVAASVSLADAMENGFTLIAMSSILFYKNWQLTLASIILTPLVIIPSIRLGRKVRRITRSSLDELAGVQHILHETITGHRIVKAFSAEQQEIHRFRTAAHRLLRFNLRYTLQQGISSPLMKLLGAVTIALFVLYARGAISTHAMSQGDFVVFLLALFKLYEPLRRMAGIYNNFQAAAGSAQHVFEFLDRDESVLERPGAKALHGFQKSVRLEDVTFEYEPGEPLLHDITLEVKRGEVVALVGTSGAGKTTLVNLIPRFFDVTGGRVLIDGVDVRDLTLKSLRGQIAYVTQDTILFDNTVAGNIAYGSAAAKPEAVRRAAEAALADEFVRAMPEGYETLLGERGLRLSGGQRQRIAIARALLKDAPILILDEATSSLDNESEMLVQRALANLIEHRTVFIVAHRLSTIRSADRILVVDGGTIAESGTHDELYAGNGIYRRLYDLQFMDLDTPQPPAAEGGPGAAMAAV